MNMELTDKKYGEIFVNLWTEWSTFQPLNGFSILEWNFIYSFYWTRRRDLRLLSETILHRSGIWITFAILHAFEIYVDNILWQRVVRPKRVNSSLKHFTKVSSISVLQNYLLLDVIKSNFDFWPSWEDFFQKVHISLLARTKRNLFRLTHLNGMPEQKGFMSPISF